MQLGASCYVIWSLAGILPVTLTHTPTTRIIIWVVMLSAGALNGFGGALLWIGQGKYVTDCSTDINKGFHFGLFWCIMMSSQLVGSVIAAFMLQVVSQKLFFILMACLTF